MDKDDDQVDSLRCYELRLKLLKDEISAQANTFDQTDSKTGVALGFTFVVVGQVLASVFRMATDQSHFQSVHPFVAMWIFCFANVSVLLAIVSGVVSRWPRSFLHSLSWDEEDLACSHLEMMKSATTVFEGIATANEKSLSKKSMWAICTYAFVALALIGYLVLTFDLYVFSVPHR